MAITSINSALRTLGFAGGVFNKSKDIVADLEFEDLGADGIVAQADGQNDAINTAEECVTAAYFYTRLIPNTKENDLFIASIWQRKLAMVPYMGLSTADQTARTESYKKILATIIEREKLTTAEVDNYFRSNIANDIENSIREAFSYIQLNTSNGKYALNIQRTVDNKYEVTQLVSGGNNIVYSLSTLDDLTKNGFTTAEVADIKTKLQFPLDNMVVPTVQVMRDTIAGFLISPTTANYNKVVDIYAQMKLHTLKNSSYTTYVLRYDVLLSNINPAFASKAIADGTARAKAGAKPAYLTQAELSKLLVPAIGGDLDPKGFYDVSVPTGTQITAGAPKLVAQN